MAAIFAVAGSAISAAGSIAGGSAAAAAGQAQGQMYEYKAQQDEMAAAEARASAQRQASEHRREGRLAESQLQARAASSGGGATDQGVMLLDAGIAGRSELGALTETYKGENRARGLEDQATMDRMGAAAAIAEGEAKQKASMFSAAGTLVNGAGSAYSMFMDPKAATYSGRNAFGYG